MPIPAAIAIAAGTLLVGCIGGLGLANMNQDEETDPLAGATTRPVVETTTENQERETPDDQESTAPAAPVSLEIPDDLVGQNAAIAEDRLREVGFTRVDFGSADPDDTVVLVPSNWTVVSVEPDPGSEINADALIVLTCSKQ